MKLIEGNFADVCQDCLLYMSYGDLPLDDDRVDAVVKGCGGFDGMHNVNDVGTFSMVGCHCCKQKGINVYNVPLWEPRS